MTTAIKGIVAYAVTPFSNADRIDVPALHSLLDWMIDAGVHAIAPLGSTGEAAYLNDEEWRVVVTETSRRERRGPPQQRRRSRHHPGFPSPHGQDEVRGIRGLPEAEHLRSPTGAWDLPVSQFGCPLEDEATAGPL